MKYLYQFECEKHSFSNPAELQAAIDGNRREGRRIAYNYEVNPGVYRRHDNSPSHAHIHIFQCMLFYSKFAIIWLSEQPIPCVTAQLHDQCVQPIQCQSGGQQQSAGVFLSVPISQLPSCSHFSIW